MRTPILLVSVLGALAAMAPSTAIARTSGHRQLHVQLGLPVVFTDPTPACPGGRVTFALTHRGRPGQGSNCLGDSVPADCPPGEDDLFCQTTPIGMTLRLHGGKVVADAGVYERWTCGDAACDTLSVAQEWSGTVTQATANLGGLAGGQLTGSSTVVFDAVTFDVLAVDGGLLIAA